MVNFSHCYNKSVVVFKTHAFFSCMLEEEFTINLPLETLGRLLHVILIVMIMQAMKTLLS